VSVLVLREGKGTASVGAAAVGRRWVLRWEEAVNVTPAAAVWLDGGRLKDEPGGGAEEIGSVRAAD